MLIVALLLRDQEYDNIGDTQQHPFFCRTCCMGQYGMSYLASRASHLFSLTDQRLSCTNPAQRHPFPVAGRLLDPLLSCSYRERRFRLAWQHQRETAQTVEGSAARRNTCAEEVFAPLMCKRRAMRLLPFKYVSLEGVFLEGVCDSKDCSHPGCDAGADAGPPSNFAQAGLSKAHLTAETSSAKSLANSVTWQPGTACGSRGRYAVAAGAGQRGSGGAGRTGAEDADLRFKLEGCVRLRGRPSPRHARP